MNKCAKVHEHSPNGKKVKFNLPSTIELSETVLLGYNFVARKESPPHERCSTPSCDPGESSCNNEKQTNYNCVKKPYASGQLRWLIWPTLPLNFFMKLSQKMPLSFFYTRVQKVKNDQKLKSRGPALMHLSGRQFSPCAPLKLWRLPVLQQACRPKSVGKNKIPVELWTNGDESIGTFPANSEKLANLFNLGACMLLVENKVPRNLHILTAEYMVSVYPVLHFPHRIPSRRGAHSVTVIGLDPSKAFTSDPELLNSGVMWGSVGLQNLLMHCPYKTSIVTSPGTMLYSSSSRSVIAITSSFASNITWGFRPRRDVFEARLPIQRPGLGLNWRQEEKEPTKWIVSCKIAKAVNAT